MLFFAVTALIVFVSYVLYQLIGTPAPNNHLDFGHIQNFEARLPEGFEHSFFHDNSGFAINMDSYEALLSFNGVEKRISIDRIRSVEKRWHTASKQKITAPGFVAASQQVSSNRSLARQAYEGSGLFLSIADINTPVIHIRVPNEGALNRIYEIFNQAREGVLERS